MIFSLQICIFFAVISVSLCERDNLSQTGAETKKRIASPRIVNGVEAEPHSIPYQVYIQSYITDRVRFCGGSLISRSYVLTAAHCLQRTNKATLMLGAHDISRNEPNRVVINVNRRYFLINRGYSESNSYNDIALIRLPTPIVLSKNIQIINLPRRSQTFLSLVGRDVIASGWGKLSDLQDDLPIRLQVAVLNVISLKVCRSYFTRVITTHICARGEDNESVCGGDSGGPLVLKEAGRSKTLIGLTSFGSRITCVQGIPAVFTRISSYLNWISANTGIRIRI